jgi:hypothetical protein
MPERSTADDTTDAAEPGAAAFDSRRDRTATDGFGAFWRDPDGTWRATADDEPVRGAADLLLRDLYDPDERVVDGQPMRIIPRAWASRHPDHPLAWVFDFAELGGREPIPVPAAEWTARENDVAGMAAPELHPFNLLGVDGVAQVLGVTTASVRSYLARGQMPAPVARIGGSPVWSRPQIERWVPTRRARGGAFGPGAPVVGPDGAAIEPDRADVRR